MYYLYELKRARDAHQTHGGVLLDFGEMYVVCRPEDAVELRCDEFENACDLALYWATMAECDYDETDPRVRKLRVRLLDHERDVLIQETSRPPAP